MLLILHFISLILLHLTQSAFNTVTLGIGIVRNVHGPPGEVKLNLPRIFSLNLAQHKYSHAISSFNLNECLLNILKCTLLNP